MPFRPDGSYYTPPWEKVAYRELQKLAPYRPPRSGFSIAAVIALLFFWPVAPILGVLALNDIRRTGKRGKVAAWLAIAVPVLMVLVTVLVLTGAAVLR